MLAPMPNAAMRLPLDGKKFRAWKLPSNPAPPSDSVGLEVLSGSNMPRPSPIPIPSLEGDGALAPAPSPPLVPPTVLVPTVPVAIPGTVLVTVPAFAPTVAALLPWVLWALRVASLDRKAR